MFSSAGTVKNSVSQRGHICEMGGICNLIWVYNFIFLRPLLPSFFHFAFKPPGDISPSLTWSLPQAASSLSWTSKPPPMPQWPALVVHGCEAPVFPACGGALLPLDAATTGPPLPSLFSVSFPPDSAFAGILVLALVSDAYFSACKLNFFLCLTVKL